MNKFKQFVFTAAIILFFVFCFAVSAFAQGERFLPSIYNFEVAADYQNASARDGIEAVLPSPLPTGGEHILFFDLGYTLPANREILIRVYGDVPAGSNLFVGALVDEEVEGFAHRSGTGIFDISLEYDSSLLITYKWPYPIRHLCLLRQCGTSASILHPDGTITPGRSDWENGKDAFIDAVSVEQKKVTVMPYKLRYGKYSVTGNSQGNKIISIWK